MIIAVVLAGFWVVAQPAASTPEYTVRVLHVYPHDPASFTQGLEYHGGFLYEGTGLEGKVDALKRGHHQLIRAVQQTDRWPPHRKPPRIARRQPPSALRPECASG